MNRSALSDISNENGNNEFTPGDVRVRNVLSGQFQESENITWSENMGAIPSDKKSKRRQIALDVNAVRRDLTVSCGCSRHCNRVFGVNAIMYWRKRIHCIPEGEERMQKIIEIIKLCSVRLKKYEKKQIFRVERKMICRNFFIGVILAVSESTVTRARSSLILGKEHVYYRAPTQHTHAVKARICEGFIMAYVNSACDRDPTGCIFRMPTALRKMDLFHLYETVHKHDHLEKSAFYAILQSKFGNVVFSATQRYTKCKVCSDYRELIQNEKEPEFKSRNMMERDLHLKEQQMEREAYYVRRSQAEMRKGEIISLIIDGMDQSKTNLPHYAYNNNPNGSGQTKLKTHITGSIVHGRGKYFFLDFNQVPHDTNLTLSCLLKILKQEACENRLPPIMYVQLDNTCRENKNKYFIGMMSYLVKKGYLREVWMSFLLVGHTHEDVDQCFSRISTKIKNRHVLTIGELHSSIEQSQLPKPASRDIGTVWDISGWLEDYVHSVHGVTFPQLYRIFLDETKHVTVKFKWLSTNEEWHPKWDERPIEIFEMHNGEQQFPEGNPPAVQPRFDDDFRDFRRSVQKDFKLAQFSLEHIDTWTKLFEDPELNEEEEWPLSSLGQYAVIEKYSTATQKEKELLDSYRKKLYEIKEVYTAQKCGDRRKYSQGEMVCYRRNTVVNIGQVLECREDTVEIRRFAKQSNTSRLIETEVVEKAKIGQCYAGGFILTGSGILPKSIKDRMQRACITLEL